MKTCHLCDEVLTLEGAIKAAGGRESRRWVGHPALMIPDGRSVHVRCGLLKGLVTLAGETGPDLVKELDSGIWSGAGL